MNLNANGIDAKRSAGFRLPLGQEDEAPDRTAIIPTMLMHTARCVMSSEVPEGMKHPVRYHADRVVLFVQLPFSSSVRDHTLHDVVPRDEVDEILFIDLYPFPHFLETEDIAHPVVHLCPVLRM
jgi:hypothetical protein